MKNVQRCLFDLPTVQRRHKIVFHQMRPARAIDHTSAFGQFPEQGRIQETARLIRQRQQIDEDVTPVEERVKASLPCETRHTVNGFLGFRPATGRKPQLRKCGRRSSPEIAQPHDANSPVRATGTTMACQSFCDCAKS